jgi:hypothetical protein
VKIYKVSFELVNAHKHPQYYCGHGDQPATDVSRIPDEHWTYVENGSDEWDDVVDQATSLLEQIAQGELIRNVKVWEADAPVWTERALRFPQTWFSRFQHEYVAGLAPGVCYSRLNDGAICGAHEGAEIHNV